MNIDLFLFSFKQPNVWLIHSALLPEASFGLRVLSSAASVGLRVCVCQLGAYPHNNSSLIPARITKFGPEMQNPTIRVLILFGDDQPLPESQILPHFELDRTITHHPFKLESLNLDHKCILALLRFLLILDLIGFDLSFHFQSWNLFFYQIYLRSFCIIFSETRHLQILVKPSLAIDWVSLGFWLNISFVVKFSRSISIASRCCNWFTNIVRLIYPLNHSGASVATVFTIPTTFGIVHVRCYNCAEWATQSVTRVGSLLLDSLTIPSTHNVPKIVFTFSPICCACTNSITIYLIIMRDFISLCIGPHQQSAISSGWLWWLVMAGIPCAPENMSHKKSITIYFHICM